jgi:hypothetical protein
MRAGSQIQAIVEQALNSALFSLEATIVSVSGGRATVLPTPKRIFGDNSEPIAYPAVENVRLVSLVWDSGKSGVSGRVSPGMNVSLSRFHTVTATNQTIRPFQAPSLYVGFQTLPVTRCRIRQG